MKEKSFTKETGKQMKGAKDAQQIDLKNLSPIIIATTSMN